MGIAAGICDDELTLQRRHLPQWYVLHFHPRTTHTAMTTHTGLAPYTAGTMEWLIERLLSSIEPSSAANKTPDCFVNKTFSLRRASTLVTYVTRTAHARSTNWLAPFKPDMQMTDCCDKLHPRASINDNDCRIYIKHHRPPGIGVSSAERALKFSCQYKYSYADTCYNSAFLTKYGY